MKSNCNVLGKGHAFGITYTKCVECGWESKNKNSIKFQWEEINITGNYATYRAKVLGGWLVVLNNCDSDGKLRTNNMIFLSDKKHEWSIEE